MSEKTTKRESYTFFNEEWNQPFWEDGVDIINKQQKNKKNVTED